MVGSARMSYTPCHTADHSNNIMSAILHLVRAQLGAQFVRPTNRRWRPLDATASWGCCYVACEALYHLHAGAQGYVPAYLKIEGDSIFSTHWILIRDDGRILDPTADQFKSSPDYSNPLRCGFLTKQPSKRTKKLMQAVISHPSGQFLRGTLSKGSRG